MKKLKVLISVLLFIAVITNACSKEENEPSRFVLTVNKGNGSGSYDKGSVITITAENAPEGEEFDKWTGDISFLFDPLSASTTITMPSQNVEVTATYKQFDINNAIPLTINFNNKFQTIDGFGFFGARDVWWGSSDPSHFHSDAWAEKVIGDLGISMWRNELYPHNPPTDITGNSQDAHWAKQKPTVQALKAKADQYGVNLRVILTAWTPPKELKWNSWGYTWPGDVNAQRGPGDSGDGWPERGSLSTNNNSGSLNPNKYKEFAQWWIDAIQMYKDAGVQVYAISPQNEPAFKQSFNSCFYTTHWYAEMIDSIAHRIKAVHPEVKIFGSEHMLLNEGRESDYPWFYHNALKNRSTAMQKMDVLAVHGYQDGVNASSGSDLAKYWTNHKNQFSAPANKKAWMTETSGYVDQWEASGNKPGALGLAIDISTALLFGDVSAWVYWQGSGLGGITEYNLMSDVTVGKKYYASKQYYHFIRPGAVRVESASSDNKLSIVAFEHTVNGTKTLVIINTKDTDVPVKLEMTGNSLPNELEMFITSATKNCASSGTKASSGVWFVPARSVVTLHAGGSDLVK